MFELKYDYNVIYYYLKNVLPTTGYLLLSIVLLNSSLVLFSKGKNFLNWYLNSVKENELIEELDVNYDINQKILKKIKILYSEIKKVNNRLETIENKLNNFNFSLSDSEDENDLVLNKNKSNLFNNFFITKYNDNKSLLKSNNIEFTKKLKLDDSEWEENLQGWLIHNENINLYVNQGAFLKNEFNDNNILLSELSDTSVVEKCIKEEEDASSESDIDINKLINEEKKDNVSVI